MQIGFIGLGQMGGGMARNLLAHCKARGHALWVHDVNAAAMRPLLDAGAMPAGGGGELASQVQVLFTSLPSAKEINAVAGDGGGVISNMPRGGVWFETSTNDVAQWKALIAAAPHLTLIDAPVTGGAEGAAAGGLTMLLGGDADAIESHRELLSSFAATIMRMGPAGAGYVAKLCQLHLNYLAAQGIGEAMMLAAKAGLDLRAMHTAFGQSCAQSYVADEYIPKVLDGSYDASFTLALARKDMRLIRDLGAHLGVELALGDAVCKRYEAACEAFGEEAPHLSNVRLLEEESGEVLRG